MNVYYSPQFIKKYKKLTKKDKDLGTLIKSKITLFLFDSKNSSLKLHKLKGELRDDWSITIKSNLRIILTHEEENVYFLDIGSHDEVYQ